MNYAQRYRYQKLTAHAPTVLWLGRMILRIWRQHGAALPQQHRRPLWQHVLRRVLR
jgi:hypothetical protein